MNKYNIGDEVVINLVVKVTEIRQEQYWDSEKRMYIKYLRYITSKEGIDGCGIFNIPESMIEGVVKNVEL